MERGLEPDDAGDAAARERSERRAVGEQSCSGVEGLAATAEEEAAEEAAAEAAAVGVGGWARRRRLAWATEALTRSIMRLKTLRLSC